MLFANITASAADMASPSDTVLQLEEVSVTAIKHSADLSRIPVASTVVGASQAERLRIVSMKEVSDIAPNFYVPDYGSRMTSSIYVRGIGTRIDQPAVGLNVDNVPYMNKDNYDFELADIERIEVLRGPQSTLFGRNTMGGLINIYTLSPMKYQGTRLMGEYGSGNSVKASLSHYMRLGSDWGMALSGNYSMTDGFFRNEYNGKKVDKERQGSFRWKLRWNPMGNMTVENTASLQITRQGGYPYQSVESGKIDYNDTCFYRRLGVTDGITLKYDRRKFSLSSITSFQYLNDNLTLDQDFLPQDYFTLTQKRHEWALTQDVVLKGKAAAYGWLCGVSGFYKRTGMSAPVTFKQYGIEQLIEKYRNDANPHYPIGWDEDSFVLGSQFKMPNYGIALYHQSDYRISRFTFSAGLRLDYERSKLDYNSDCNTSYTVYDNYQTASAPTVFSNNKVMIDGGGTLEKSYVELLPKFTITYDIPSSNSSSLYVSVSKGYKAGGFNTQMFSDVLQQRIMGLMGLSMKYDVDDIVSYKPEKSWDYEAGAHLCCLDGKLRAEFAAFYIDCRDQQLTMFPDGSTTGRIMTNAGKTRSLGCELSLGWDIAPRVRIDLSYGYTNAKFIKFDNGLNDYSGNRIPYAPENTFFAGVSYTLPVGQKWLERISFNANLHGIGDICWDEENLVRQPFYAVLNASVRFEAGPFSFDIWGDNLTDTQFSTFYFVSIGNAFLQRGNPARGGITLRINFQSNKS